MRAAATIIRDHDNLTEEEEKDAPTAEICTLPARGSGWRCESEVRRGGSGHVTPPIVERDGKRTRNVVSRLACMADTEEDMSW